MTAFSNWRSVCPAPLLAAILTLTLVPDNARAQTIFPLYGSMEGGDRIMRFTSGGVGSIFADFTTGLSTPTGLAFDAAGNLYVANANSATVVRLTPAGSASVFIGTALLGQGPTGGMTFDSYGNLFVGVGASGTGGVIKKFSSTGADLGVFASSGISNPYDLTFDTSGNLIVPNGGNSTIRIFTPAGVGSTLADNGGLLNHPSGVAFDRSGNLFVANGGDSNILKFTPGGVGSVFAGPANSGVAAPFGLAFDAAGNLYVASSANTSIRKLTPGGVGSTFASGGLLSLPFGLAFTPSPTPFVRIASFATPIPEGTGNFTSLPNAPGYSSTGAVAFYGEGTAGQAGIYRMGNAPPIKVADLTTAIPGGTGNFTAFHPGDPTYPGDPTVSGNNVAFFGAGGGGQQGVYVFNQQIGAPAVIANASTAIPGGVGNFTAFTQTGVAASPVISGNKVAFFGAGSGTQQGIYTQDYVTVGATPVKIADTATLIPGGIGAFTAFPQHPSLSGDNVAFLATGAVGQQGVYRAVVGGSPIKVANLNTPIPTGGGGNFTSFIPGTPYAPAIDGTSVAFFGAGSGGQQGIYESVNGSASRIADTSTAIPGGTGLFLSFGAVSLSDTDVAFLGFGANGQEGIYDLTGGTLVKVVDFSDVLGGRSITGLTLSRTGLFGDPLAFQATFADGSQGVYTATVPVPEPGTMLLCGFGALGLAWMKRKGVRNQFRHDHGGGIIGS